MDPVGQSDATGATVPVGMRIDHRGTCAVQSARSLHLAIGIFDGVHLGHQAVIDSAVASAARAGGMAGVLTFDPHPSRVLRPDAPTLLMMPPELKRERLFALGVDAVVWKTFDREFAALSADGFLGRLRELLPMLRSVHVGANFRFGKGRGGDVHELIRCGRLLRPRVDVYSIDRLQYNGEAVSSSRIREALGDGRIDEVNALLGYSYYCCAEVVGGMRLGRALGFPTLNLPWNPEARPRFGVYALQVRDTHGGEARLAVANYGLRPTLQDAREPLLEVHLLDGATEWAVGARLRAEWLAFIRPEQKFADARALRARIEEDCRVARELLAG